MVAWCVAAVDDDEVLMSAMRWGWPWSGDDVIVEMPTVEGWPEFRRKISGAGKIDERREKVRLGFDHKKI
ncbi:hypothetical protein Tco_1396107 [Tanacetum coccineum]